jgi:putative membrane protein
MAAWSWLNPLTWPIEPWVLLGVEVAAILYIWGAQKEIAPDHSLPRLRRRVRVGAFWSALAVIVFALDTPLEWLARQLFWAHMTQHLLLIMVAAPLLVLASPWLRIWRGLPLRIRRPLARVAAKHPTMAIPRGVLKWLSAPTAAFILSTVNLWAWHWPVLYDLTLRNHAVHHLEHALFLGLGILFWAQVIEQYPFRLRLSAFQRASYVFLGTIQSWALAAVLAFATTPYYAYALLPSRPGGISALADQQLGAGIMWVPGSITYSIVFLAALFLWFREEDERGQALSARPVGIAK